MSDPEASNSNSPAAATGTVAPPLTDGTESVNEERCSYTVTSPVSANVHQETMEESATAAVNTPIRTDISGVSQLPTVYLPPIHYTYDRDTGKLIQMTQGNGKNIGSVPIPRTTVLNNNAVSTSATVPNVVKSAPLNTTHLVSPAPPANQPYTAHTSQISRNIGAPNVQRIVPESAQTQVLGAQYPPVSTSVTPPPPTVSMGMSNPVQQMMPGGYGSSYVTYNNVGQPMGVYAAPPQWQSAPGFGGQTTFDTAAMPYPNVAPQQVDPYTASPTEGASTQTFANSLLRTYNGAARVCRSFDDMSAGAMVNGVQRMLHPVASDFVKAAVFRFRRLEDVPVLAPTPNRVSYSLVAYFDPATENYGVYHSSLHHAHPGYGPQIAQCDLDGDVVKIPWQGEPYVFVKIVEHINQMETVVGRLKLHMESMVRNHPLRVNIISDKNCLSGNVIFEFNVGHMSYEELRDAQDNALKAATERRKMDYQYRSNTVPDYDTYVKQHRQYQRDRAAAEYQRPQPVNRQRARPQTLGEVQIPAALNHFVSSVDVWYAPRQENYRSRGQGTSNNRNNNSSTRRGGKQESESMICKHHAMHDHCRYGGKCMYRHTLKRLLYLPDVCPKGVCAVTVCRVSDSRLDLYAVGQGTNIRRLSIAGDVTGGVSLVEQNTFTLNIQDVLKRPYQTRTRRARDQFIFSLRCINDCLFAGIRTGHISVFHLPTGTSTLIYGHEAPVMAMILVDSAVLSACEEGKICIWSFDSNSNSFTCLNSLETKTTISCLLEVTDGVNRCLWAAGSAITIIDLTTLAIVKSCPIPNGDFAKSMMRYGQHVIVALHSGDCAVLDTNLTLVYRSGGDGVALTAMDGMQSEQGDLLLLGNKSGLLNLWQIPAFNLEGTLNCAPEGPRNYKWSGISAITSLGGGLFVISGYDGNMHVFRYVANTNSTAPS
ncbi:uncharacterized protein BXIN_0105 [Babesia sp. Xinjiang]|uniref:uncharacterized protein n=1 Tax=Babesia sp. Xinjiang TaxID=462227 RepID=UPI000A26623A|nr:uncharacterized protein BXIN_0105 [Babesia sp. Xinjiang]ORM39706.1 hypothetical protein BXIN_0105 [Babesia sp. Xinjiang]